MVEIPVRVEVIVCTLLTTEVMVVTSPLSVERIVETWETTVVIVLAVAVIVLTSPLKVEVIV